jgi:hypothetical protein
VAPGSNEYVIGRPFIERATLALPNGKRFTVRARNLSGANGYVGSVLLNGQPLARSYLRHELAWYRILTADNRKISDEKSPAGKVDYHTMGACYEVLPLLERRKAAAA